MKRTTPTQAASTPGIRGAAAIALLAWVHCSVMAADFSAEAPDLSKLPPAATVTVDFARDIQPLLADRCVKCHGPEKQKGGLRLDSRAAAVKGGDDGSALVPGKSAESKLVHLVAGLDPDAVMPPKGERLTAQQIGLLRAWIDQGAVWPDGGKVARSEHWAFQKIRPLAELEAGVARDAANPIDAFISARLAAKGLAFSPPADRATLIRRLSFDLLGLPPTPQEIDAFVADSSPRAYEELVERLLASPRHGERWGRHWLDVVRYTESQGFEYDHPRDNAWHYRDYVIKSFNDDKPYDRFMKEQVAGDALEPVTSEGVIATSLLVCGPWDQAGNIQSNLTQKAITREEEMEDMISVVGQTFLGLTVNCARCHSHKFDPIPQEEYYRIKSVFDGVRHGERPIGNAAEVKPIEDRIAALKAEVKTAQENVARIEAEGQKLATTQPDAAAADKQRAAHDEALARLKKAQDELAAIKPPPVSYAGFRVQPEPTHLLRRGDVKSPGDVVRPGALSAVADLDADFGLAPEAPQAERLLKFSAWLADPRNPLPARVMANRVWHFHFGQGLVATPSDFGVSGARPTHPELLDWLAAKFIESGWTVKALHRLIVNSAAYRQSSEVNEAALKLDADNTLLWRWTPRRLEAEAVRDAMLTVSGQLNLQMGGPSFRPFTTTNFNATFYHLFDKGEPEFNRRTVYRMNINSGKEPLLDAFDCPEPSVKTPRRGVTTTPLQALELMNSSFVQRQADGLAARALNEAKQDLPGAVQAAYRLALNRPATPPEMERALAAAKERSLASVCWALLNSTEFIYVR